ncbi:cilia- and flagella-associated protein [Raphidocelis subcapitata]|uniref:Cilia-and flagella-associated protein n=1 Tax=Raphidocelis subcapitata TaxID=307507 RepID=A0A2V0NZ42_9CHLO|nr:cilia- and flagella-associated protein [Raphidocelis subcapitata]|eukprot:GBF92886.1 cilia- and flagella-associated protein [Raphidocelis subcapitata]
MQSGSIVAVVASFDDSLVLAAARDGSLLAAPIGLPDAPQQQPGDPPALPPLAAAGTAAAEDLAPGAPSFEEGRQAAVKNALAARAADARRGLAAEFEALRHELADLLAANAARPPSQRLERAVFAIDPGLQQLADCERIAKLDDARARVVWDAEAAARLFHRLRTFFAAELAASSWAVLPLAASGTGVSSSPMLQLPQDVQVELEVAAAEAESDASACSGRSSGLQQTHGAALDECTTRGARHEADLSGQVQADLLASGSSKATLRHEARRQREAQWAALHAARPDPATDAPEDAEAMRVAAATIRDLRLRSAPGYVPEEDQRMTPLRKRRHMLELARAMAQAHSEVGNSISQLRGERGTLLRRLAAIASRLDELDSKLGAQGAGSLGVEPVEMPAEMEQAWDEVTEQQLLQYAARKAADLQQKQHGGLAGLGGFATPGSSASAPQQGDGAAPASAVAMPAPASSAACAHVARLAVRRDELACDLCSSAARQLVRFEELCLLKEFEVRELVLLDRLAAKTAERSELSSRLAELSAQIEAKRAEGETLGAARAAVLAEFEALVEDKEPFVEALTQIFNRRIKRTKRQAGGAGGDGASNGGGSEDSEGDEDDPYGDGDDDSGDDGDYDDGAPEVCPPGCEQALYDRVCELREARLDEEDAAADAGRAADTLRKEREVLSKKGRLMEQSLAAINQDMLEFQREKQARLNCVPVEVALRASQVQVPLSSGAGAGAGAGGASGARASAAADVDSGALEQAVVVPQSCLDRLAARAEELDAERAALQASQRELRRRHTKLVEDKAERDGQLEEQRARCRDVQLLKFGREMDVSLLDTIGVRNHAAEELQAALKQQERVQAQELEDLEAGAVALTHDLLDRTRTNTSALNAVSSLTRGHRSLESEVLSHGPGLFQDQLQTRKAALAERHALVAGVKTRAATLQELSSRIAALRRKDVFV